MISIRKLRNKACAIDLANCECEVQYILTMYEGGQSAGFCVLLVVMLSLAGCATTKINARFPDVPLRKPAAGATKVGVARVEDSRASRVAASIGGNGLIRSDLLAGPDLLSYIDHKFRNGLADRRFDPVVAPDPAKSSLAQPYKIVVVTLQSATYGFPVWKNAGSAIDIAVQVYSPAHKIIFADSYSGADSGKPSSVMAVAADNAVEAALADAKLESALR